MRLAAVIVSIEVFTFCSVGGAHAFLPSPIHLSRGDQDMRKKVPAAWLNGQNLYIAKRIEPRRA
jgi:hypothetical protein